MAFWKLPRLFMCRKCWRAFRKGFGGTLLQLVLEDIVGNFSNKKPDRKILQALFDAEQALLRSGILSSDFTLIVARHREQPVTG
jgi:hypothetical protein